MKLYNFLKHIVYLYENGFNELLLENFDERIATLGGYGSSDSIEKRALLRLLPLKWDALLYLDRSSSRLCDMAEFIDANTNEIDLFVLQTSIMKARNILYLLDDLIGVCHCSNRAILAQKISICFQQNNLPTALNFISNFESCETIPDYEKQLSVRILHAGEKINVCKSHLKTAILHFLPNDSIRFDASFYIDKYTVQLCLPFPLNETASLEGKVQVINTQGNTTCYPIDGRKVVESRYYSPFGGLYSSQNLNISINNVRAFGIA